MRKKTLTLNCDMGEGLDALDLKIMPYIDMVNIACGGHAGDEISMSRTVLLAKQYNVIIGAHPSFLDKQGFGRQEKVCNQKEISQLIQTQCATLENICQSHAVSMHYVKPHGALYNMMMKDKSLFEYICQALSQYNNKLKLMILSNKQNHVFANIAQKYGITLLYEVFADRGYSMEGFLVPRSDPQALLKSKEMVLERATSLLSKGSIESTTGEKLVLEADTLCVHSDTEGALELIQTLHKFLETNHAT